MNYENFISAVKGLALKYQRANPDMYLHTDISKDSIIITYGGNKEKLRKEWVDMMLDEFSNYYGDDSKVILCDKKRKVLVAYFESDWNGDEHGHGIARCSADDEFDENVGLAVAFAHFREYPIPDFV